MKKYLCTDAIDHDGKLYSPGEVIEMTEAQADKLKALAYPPIRDLTDDELVALTPAKTEKKGKAAAGAGE